MSIPGELGPLEHAFSHHPPTGGKIVQHEAVRADAKRFAATILIACPPSAERRQAVMRLREALMWANAAIACNDPHAEAVDLAQSYGELAGGTAPAAPGGE